MSVELILGPIPYLGGTLGEAELSKGSFCRLTDTLIFTIYRQSTPNYTFAQISTIDNIRAAVPVVNVIRTQRLLEVLPTAPKVGSFTAQRLSDKYVAVFCRTPGVGAEIRIFFVNTQPDVDNHTYVVTQVGNPISINDLHTNVISAPIGQTDFSILPSVVDNVCIFEYPAASGYRTIKRLVFTPGTDPTTGTTAQTTIVGGSVVGANASTPLFVKHSASTKWSAVWGSGTTTVQTLTAAFDPTQPSTVTPVALTGTGAYDAAGNSCYMTPVVTDGSNGGRCPVFLPQSDIDGLLFDGESNKYDVVTAGVGSGTRREYGTTSQLGTYHYPMQGWWLDDRHLVMVSAQCDKGSSPNTNWSLGYRFVPFYSTGGSPAPATDYKAIVRVIRYIDPLNVAVSYGTAVPTPQFNSTNTPDYQTLKIFPQKTEMVNGDTIVFYGYDSATLKYVIKTVRLSQ